MGLPLSKKNWPVEVSSYAFVKKVYGEGKSEVFRASCKTNNKECVIKKMDVADSANKSDAIIIRMMEDIEREIEAFKAFSEFPHDNIIKYYQYFVEDNRHYIVMELMHCNLSTVVDRHYFRYRNEELILGLSPLNNVVVATILRQVLEALKHMHAHKIMHRDVKLENILMNEDGTVKLCDFGILGKLNETRMTRIGTTRYMAPETFLEKPYNEAADIWSFGIVSIFLSTGRIPNEDLFEEYDIDDEQIKQELQTRAPPDLTTEEYASFGDESFKDVIRSCMKIAPNERKTASQLLELRFFANYDKGKIVEWIKSHVK